MYYCPFYCYIRSPLKFRELNQQPCYSVHELYGSGKGTGQDSLSLLHDVWGAQTTGWLTHLGPDCPRGAIVHLSGILAGGGKDGLHLAASSRSLFWVSKLIPGWAAPLGGWRPFWTWPQSHAVTPTTFHWLWASHRPDQAHNEGKQSPSVCSGSSSQVSLYRSILDARCWCSIFGNQSATIVWKACAFASILCKTLPAVTNKLSHENVSRFLT